MKKLLLVCIPVLFFSFCTKDKAVCPTNDYFIFGTGFGYCGGDCATLYQLKGDKIYPDNVNNIYLDSITFSNTPLPDSCYQLASALPSAMPQYMLDRPGDTFGCPDCYDQGVIYIETRRNGTVGKWKIDPAMNALPVEIQAYIQNVSGILNRLR